MKKETLSAHEAHLLAAHPHLNTERRPVDELPAAPGTGGARERTTTPMSPLLKLRVKGMSRTPAGRYVYRVETRDGHYVGQTLPTSKRALLGDVLEIQPNAFRKEHTTGDFLWVNPHVMGRSLGRAHERRILETFAGGHMAKDLPASGDTGAGGTNIAGVMDNVPVGTAAASGPTSTDVHVNRPLKRISVMYGAARKEYEIHKAAPARQVVYGVVLEPNTVDSQNDIVPPDAVEQAAHRYLKKAVRGQSSVHKIQHRGRGFFRSQGHGLVPVESFVAPVDFTYNGRDWIRKGSWVLAAHVEDPNLWCQIVDGTYTGWSVGGSGKRQPVDGVPVLRTT